MKVVSVFVDIYGGYVLSRIIIGYVRLNKVVIKFLGVTYIVLEMILQQLPTFPLALIIHEPSHMNEWFCRQWTEKVSCVSFVESKTFRIICVGLEYVLMLWWQRRKLPDLFHFLLDHVVFGLNSRWFGRLVLKLDKRPTGYLFPIRCSKYKHKRSCWLNQSNKSAVAEQAFRDDHTSQILKCNGTLVFLEYFKLLSKPIPGSDIAQQPEQE